jgi:hypothetical protein
MEWVLANVTDHRLAPYRPQSRGVISRRFSQMNADQIRVHLRKSAAYFRYLRAAGFDIVSLSDGPARSRQPAK